MTSACAHRLQSRSIAREMRRELHECNRVGAGSLRGLITRQSLQASLARHLFFVGGDDGLLTCAEVARPRLAEGHRWVASELHVCLLHVAYNATECHSLQGTLVLCCLLPIRRGGRVAECGGLLNG